MEDKRAEPWSWPFLVVRNTWFSTEDRLALGHFFGHLTPGLGLEKRPQGEEGRSQSGLGRKNVFSLASWDSITDLTPV